MCSPDSGRCAQSRASGDRPLEGADTREGDEGPPGGGLATSPAPRPQCNVTGDPTSNPSDASRTLEAIGDRIPVGPAGRGDAAHQFGELRLRLGYEGIMVGATGFEPATT